MEIGEGENVNNFSGIEGEGKSDFEISTSTSPSDFTIHKIQQLQCLPFLGASAMK